MFAHATLHCTFLLLCFIQSSSFQSLNIKAPFLSHSENKGVCIFIRVLLNSFVLSDLLQSNIIHESLTSPTYTGTLPRVRALGLHSYMMLHMVQIFISHDAICCFQVPYQVQHIHYGATIHMTTNASTAIASSAYSCSPSVKRYCPLICTEVHHSRRILEKIRCIWVFLMPVEYTAPQSSKSREGMKPSPKQSNLLKNAAVCSACVQIHRKGKVGTLPRFVSLLSSH